MSKNFSDLSPKQLRDAAVLKEKIEGLQAQLNGLLGNAQPTTKAPVKKAAKKKRTMSPEARAKIAAAQRKRWQKQKKQAA